MVMKNVKIASKESANFFYLNHALKNIFAPEGVEILESPVAFKKYSWLKKYWQEKPKEGYFIWVKQQPKQPLTACVAISRLKTNQKLRNLLIIEKDINAESSVSCSAFAIDLCAKHQAQGMIVLKEGASLSYKHMHSWGKDDYVEPDYEFILEKGAKLDYFYQLLNPPKELTFKTKISLLKKASANMKIVVRGEHSSININEEMIFLGKQSQGSVSLRLVADKQTIIKGVNQLIAEKEARGHLNCQGMILDDHSFIQLIPALTNKNKKSLLTHEASIGKINEEEINYLRSRGLSLKEAINLIVNGFLHLDPLK